MIKQEEIEKVLRESTPRLSDDGYKLCAERVVEYVNKKLGLVKLRCQVCGTEWMGEPPQMCCDGRDCGCGGRPIDPILCSKECGDKLFGKQYEYEMFFNSDPGEPLQIHGWYPIATDRIKHPEKIEEYISKGLLRRIKDGMEEKEIAPTKENLIIAFEEYCSRSETIPNRKEYLSLNKEQTGKEDRFSIVFLNANLVDCFIAIDIRDKHLIEYSELKEDSEGYGFFIDEQTYQRLKTAFNTDL